MKVRLVPLFTLSRRTAVAVCGPQFLIGRADDCDLCLRSNVVSRRHCALILDHDELRVRDLESSNGTFVNNERVGCEKRLKNGDILGVATAIFKVEIRVSGSGIRLLSRFGHAFAGALR